MIEAPVRSAVAPRLLIVTTVYDMARDFLLPYARRYRSRGWRVDALASPDATFAESAAAFDRAWTIDWSRRPAELWRMGRSAEAVRALVEREDYDIVHVHTPIAGLVTRFALRARRRWAGTQVIYTAHGFHFHPGGRGLPNAAFLAAEKRAGGWTDFLVVINADDHAAVLRHAIVPEERLLFTPGVGFDPAIYDPARVSPAAVAALRGELGLRPRDRLVTMIAEFTANKRHADVVEAFALAEREDAHLAIAGRPGPTLEATRQLVASLGLERRVHLLGFRDDIPTLIRASEATVLASAREGLPRSVIESLALGVPVVATRIRGIRDLVGAGSGHLVEVGDLPALARALAWVIDHPGESRRLGEAGRAAFCDAYGFERVAALHDELYERALERRGRRSSVEPSAARSAVS
jgi:glycosyltransferase involved in cell wall biosynthesis